MQAFILQKKLGKFHKENWLQVGPFFGETRPGKSWVKNIERQLPVEKLRKFFRADS